MVRRSFRHILYGAAIVASLPGCCSVYVNRPVTFHVRDAETKQPIEGAAIKVVYMRFMEISIPMTGWGPTEGVTDRDGKLTLVVDPYKDRFMMNTTAKGYLPEEHRSGTWVTKRVAPRKRFEWKNDFVLELYAEPLGDVDLVFPKDYRGVVLVRFAPTDHPPDVPGRRRVRYDVPASGVVEIKESWLLERPLNYTRIHAQLRDGTTVPTLDGPGALEDWDARRHQMDDAVALQPYPMADAIALRFIEPDWEHNTWIYVLGTKREADSVREPKSPTLSEADQRDLDRLMRAGGN
jgi:hypothetical protein